MRQFGLIPRSRLMHMPPKIRGTHEYCFFLHDQSLHMLMQYQEAEAHQVEFPFKDAAEAKKFQEIADATDSIAALRKTGRNQEARRVVINAITVSMVTDCLIHLFEALKCFEKRKTIVALNILRKPLKDSLSYLAWVLGDEDQFYDAFTRGPEHIAQNKIGNIRSEIFRKAISQTKLAGVIKADVLNWFLFDRKNPHGLELWFQHAVHLVTIQYAELKTSSENFNFIFKGPSDDDVYESVYACLPYILLFLSHVIAGLFGRMREMDVGANDAFTTRSVVGLTLAMNTTQDTARDIIRLLLPEGAACGSCRAPVALTDYNTARLLLADSYRCTGCRRISLFPLAWLF